MSMFMQHLRKANQSVQRKQQRQLGFSQRGHLEANVLISSKLVISMSTSYPTRGPGFGAFLIGDMLSGNRIILLCILKGLQMRLSRAELPSFALWPPN